jgi:hypothetical protein
VALHSSKETYTVTITNDWWKMPIDTTKHYPCGHWHKTPAGGGGGGGGGGEVITSTNKLVPLLVVNNYDEVQVFEDCLSADPDQDAPWPADGTDIMETYVPYGIDTATFKLASLKPIAAANCEIFARNTYTEIANGYTDDIPAEDCGMGKPDANQGGDCYDGLTYNNCGGTTFWVDWEKTYVYWPPGGTVTYTGELEYDIESYFAIVDNATEVGTPAGLPASYHYHYREDTTTIVTHSSPLGSGYYYVESQGYYADCDDAGDINYTSSVVATGNVSHHTVIASAVVKGAAGYTDYATWGCIYAILSLGTPNATVYLALCDPVNGFRQYKLEDVDYLGPYNNIADVGGFGKVDIFDYKGTPYFVCSYVGLEIAGPQ